MLGIYGQETGGCDSITTLPYTENFENYTSYSAPECWTRVLAWYNSSGKAYPYVYNNSDNAHQGSGYLYFYGGDNFIALPRINIPTNSLRVTFWMKPGSTLSTYGRMELGVMTDLSDTSSFQIVQSWTAVGINDGTHWRKYIVDLSNVTPTDSDYIVFRRFVNAANGWYMDDVTVDYIPSCEAPADLSCVSITSSEAVLTWDPGLNSLFNVYYKPVSDSVYMLTSVVALDADSLFTLSNLTPGTYYDCYVTSLCGDGTETPSDPITFSTHMLPSDIPYATDFAPNSDQDWMIDNGSCANRWKMGTVPGSPLSALYITANDSTPGYSASTSSVVSASKLFTIGEEPLVKVSFDILAGGESSWDYVKLFVAPEDVTYPASTASTVFSSHFASVGYSTYAYDFSNYLTQSGGSAGHPYKYNLTGGNTVHIDALMPNPNVAPDSNSTLQVVFLWRNDGGSGTQPGAVITNVSVSVPNCPQPDSVEIVGLTPESVDIIWEGGDATAWIVEYGPHGFNPGSGVVVNVSGSPAVALPGLTPHTEYDVYLTAVCDLATSPVKVFSFYTPCQELVSVPQTWNFETDLTQGTATFPYPGCWSRIITGNANQYPYADEYAYYAYSNPYALLFDNYYPNAYAVLPSLNPDSLRIDTLQVTFYAQATAPNLYTALEVGVMSDPEDPETFTLVRSFNLPSGYYDNPYKVMFTNFTGEGNHIAFRNTASGPASNAFYVDNVTLSKVPACCTAQQMSAVPGTYEADLTWAGTSNTFDLYYKSVTDTDYMVVQGVSLTDGHYMLSGLTPGTAYYWYLVSNCDSALSYTSSVGAFTTLCEGVTELPQSWNFESGLTAGTSEYPLPYCWEKVGIGNEPFPYVFTSTLYTHSGNHTLFFYNLYPNTFGVMPNVDANQFPMSGIQVSFYARLSAMMGDTRLVVGIMENPSDTASFVPIDTLVLGNEYPADPYIVPFADYEGYGTYVAFKNIAASPVTNYIFIDDVTLSEIPSCPAPTGVASFPASNFANLRWDNMTEGYYHLYYRVESDSVYSSQMFLFLTDSIYTLGNLSPATEYSFYVVSVCDNGSEVPSEVYSFTTLCEPEVAPYVENFGSGTLPLCWEQRIGWASDVFAGALLQPTSNGWEFSGTHAFNASHPTLRIYGNNTKYWLLSPVIDLSTLTEPVLTFQLALTDYAIDAPIENPNAQQDDKFMVIVSTDYGETWDVANATVWSNGTGATHVFNQIPYDGEEILIPLGQYAGQSIRIAFYGESSAAGGDNDLHIANLTVQEMLTCPAPSSLVLTELADVSASVTWTENGTAATWLLEYDTIGFTPGTGTVVSVTGTPAFTLTGLAESTSYDLYVQAVCGPNNYSNPIFKSFTTSCSPITLPYFQDFDNVAAGINDYFVPCWHHINNYSANQYPYVSNTYAYSGSNSLYFYNTISTYSVASLPMVDPAVNPVNTLQISFYMRSNYTSSRIVVGVMSDPMNIGTFEPVDTVYVSGDGVFGYKKVKLDSYAGNGRYVSLRLLNTANNAPVYVDDVTLEVIPSCPKPESLTVGNVTEESALVWWLEAGDATAWNVKVSDGVTENILSANATSLLLANLAPATTYTVSVQAACAADDLSEWSAAVTFTTDTAVMPEICNPPAGLHVSETGSDHIVVEWENADGVSSWNVECRQLGTSSWTAVTSATPVCTVSGLADSTTYEIRVQALCENGISSEWSETVMATTLTGIAEYLADAIVLYPNPANHHLDIRTSNSELNINSLEVIDTYGRIVAVANVDNSFVRINVSDFADGMYFVKVSIGGGYVVKTFVKKR